LDAFRWGAFPASDFPPLIGDLLWSAWGPMVRPHPEDRPQRQLGRRAGRRTGRILDNAAPHGASDGKTEPRNATPESPRRCPNCPRPQRTSGRAPAQRRFERSPPTTTEKLKNHVSHLSNSGNIFLVDASNVNGVFSLLSLLFAPEASAYLVLLKVVLNVSCKTGHASCSPAASHCRWERRSAHA